FFLRLDTGAFQAWDSIVALMVLALPVQAFVILRFGFHRQSWGIVSGADIKRLVIGLASGSVALALEAWFLQRYTPVPRSVPILAGGLSLVLLGGTRLSLRWWREGRRARTRGA